MQKPHSLIGFMTQILKQKVALVTGGSGDIGVDIALLFAQQGAKVVTTFNKRKDKMNPLLRKAEAEGLDLKAYKLNVADEESVRSFFLSHFGSQAPDILVNVAGHSNEKILVQETR